MTEHVDQVAGLLGGLAVLLALAGYVFERQRRLLAARLGPFAGAGSIPVEPAEARSVGSPRRLSSLRRIRLGARSAQLAQAGVSVTPRRFLFLQLAAGLLGLGLTFQVARPLNLPAAT